MRNIGILDDAEKARLFGEVLYAAGIENQVEQTADGRWAVWVASEDQIREAADRLEKFRQAGDLSPYVKTAAQAAARRGEDERTQKAAERRFRTAIPSAFLGRPGWLTILLIGVSVIAAIFSRMGTDLPPIRWLFISEYGVAPGVPWWKGLLEVRHGQVWRLVTPIFIHFGMLHLLFNMLWLRDLGGMIERIEGTLKYAAMILVIAVCSNLAQVAVHGPSFGGMSGIVYGFLGYAWMRGKRDPSSPLLLHPSTVTMMAVWFVLGWTGLLGNMANIVHTVGLGLGVAWGYLDAAWKRRR